MKRLFVLLLMMGLLANSLYSQRYMTRNGNVRLTYNAPAVSFVTDNRQVSVALDVETGELRMQMLMLSFRFRSAYNQEKFNEYFINHPQYANSTFIGHITNIDEIDFDKPGTYSVDVSGELTIRDDTNTVSTTGDFIVKDDIFAGESTFSINLREFGVNVPQGMPVMIDITMDVSVRRL